MGPHHQRLFAVVSSVRCRVEQGHCGEDDGAVRRDFDGETRRHARQRLGEENVHRRVGFDQHALHLVHQRRQMRLLGVGHTVEVALRLWHRPRKIAAQFLHLLAEHAQLQVLVGALHCDAPVLGQRRSVLAHLGSTLLQRLVASGPAQRHRQLVPLVARCLVINCFFRFFNSLLRHVCFVLFF